MAGLREENKWENEIYRIEESDPVVGGEDGISNKPQKQLANRTQWLKAKINELFGKNTPKKITKDTTNLVANDGHTHEIEKGSLTTSGIVQLTDSVNQDSSVFAATAKAVKTAFDKAVGAYNAAAGKVSKAGDTMTGVLRAADFVMNRNGNQKLSSLFDALLKLARGDATGFQNIANTWGNAGTTPLGITYNFTNANAWYICFGPFFGNLIIQGGRYELLSGETYKIVKIPISVKLMLEAINYQAEHGAATKAPMWAYGWNIAKANNTTEVCFLSSYSGDLQRYLCVGIG